MAKGKKKQFSVGFSEAAHDWLEVQAGVRGVGKAEFIRRLVDQVMYGDGQIRGDYAKQSYQQLVSAVQGDGVVIPVPRPEEQK
jgi:hypothetical protein